MILPRLAWLWLDRGRKVYRARSDMKTTFIYISWDREKDKLEILKVDLKGVPNKVTTDLKTWIASILDDGRDKFKKDMDDLDSSERVKVYINLINYVLPKQQAVVLRLRQRLNTRLLLA